MKPVATLHVIPNLEIGGAERQLVSLLKRIDRTRFDVSLCCLDGAGALFDEVKAERIETFIIGRRPGIDLVTLARLIRLFRTKRPIIVHSWLFIANVYSRLAAVFARIPVVVTAEGGVGYHYGFRRMATIKMLDRILAPLSNSIIANSEQVKLFVISEGINPRRVAVINNGIDVDRLRAEADSQDVRKRLGIEPSSQIVGTVARFDPNKDFATFLEAAVRICQALPQTRFLVVGDGQLRDQIFEQARNLGLWDKFVFTGYQESVGDLLSVFDVFVLSSLREGLPNAVLEAMAVGIPVVATDAGGTAEAVAPGQTGYLVPVGDPHAMAEAVLVLLRDDSLNRQMGKLGQDRVKSLFSLDQLAQRTMGLYDSLTASRVKQL